MGCGWGGWVWVGGGGGGSGVGKGWVSGWVPVIHTASGPEASRTRFHHAGRFSVVDSFLIRFHPRPARFWLLAGFSVADHF